MFYSFSVISKDAPSPIQRDTIYFLDKFYSVLDLLLFHLLKNHPYKSTPISSHYTPTATDFCINTHHIHNHLLVSPFAATQTQILHIPLATTSSNETYFFTSLKYQYTYTPIQGNYPTQSKSSSTIYPLSFLQVHAQRNKPIDKMK